jgi:hypothetical protein
VVLESSTGALERRPARPVAPGQAGFTFTRENGTTEQSSACKTKSGDSVMNHHYQASISSIGYTDVPAFSTAMTGAARA